ncbi:MAG TPA: DUF3379 family protein [Steroidobacteraceae bacterium]|nr:DUF3379 family protein [Steroidobacteraceae bacterium]
MNCLDYRRCIETEPGPLTPEMQVHVQGCAACTAWSEEAQAFEARLKQALAVDVPPARALPPLYALPARRFALAAGILAAVAVATLAWLSFPRDTLAAEVVAHVEEEPQSWAAHTAITTTTLDEVLERPKVSAQFADSVSYARTCWFRGHLVPHLVVRDEHGAVTVLILGDEQVSGKVSFSEHGMRGVILPAAHGSIAVLARGDRQVDAVAEKIREALGS